MAAAFLLGLLAGTGLGVFSYPLLIRWVAAREHAAASAEADRTPRARRAVAPGPTTPG
ncbi:MAG TPA: hypothetical protein VNP94_08415 [Actinomycetota bacterium]|nr:hypothetical protein [Actinomycetota bacterium]